MYIKTFQQIERLKKDVNVLVKILEDDLSERKTLVK